MLTADGERIDYDALVLATGSYAFVPPVPGHDLPSCHVYRTLDDLDAIRADALRAVEARPRRRSGVVIGGGLLGLEAANALRQFGLQTHVVEMAPRLMAQQLDEAGGALLGRMIDRPRHHRACRRRHRSHRAGTTQSARPAVRRGRLGAGDAERRDGHRRRRWSSSRRVCVPATSWPAAADIEVAERGGVLTDLSCATRDPNIYAIGEVAAIEGRCYGLVGPGYTSAEVVADRLLGGAAEFPEADMSTKLKLLGVDVASFGDAMGRTPDCLEVVVNDAVNQTYAKLVLSDDAKTLLGGILVGDASSYGVLRPMVGEALPGDPMALIAPAGSEGGAGDWVSARFRPPRRSARATTSPRAISPRPSRAAAATSPS